MPCTEETIKSGSLVIRYSEEDIGDRPINPCNNYWLSPDIWLEGGFDATRAQVGVENRVKVRIKNNSENAINHVNVQVWVCDFTAGVSPNSGLASAGGDLPMTGYAQTIDGNAFKEIVCDPPWRPNPDDAILNGGHVCLAANCYSEDIQERDGAPIPTGAFNFCCDSHHGQRNIAVIKVEKPSPERPLGEGEEPSPERDFGFFAANPSEVSSVESVLTISQVTGQEELSQSEHDLLRSGPYANREIHLSPYEALDFQLEGEGFEPGTEVSLSLKPNERREMKMKIVLNPAVEVDSLTSFEVEHKTRDGELLGGFRVLALVVPENEQTVVSKSYR